MKKKIKVLIGIVTYYPDKNQIKKRVEKLSSFFNILIIDNSEKSSFSEIDFRNNKVLVRKMKSNVGAAGGARMISYYALRCNYEVVVFFDQDSEFDIVRLNKAIVLFKETQYDICYAFTDIHNNKTLKEDIIPYRIGIFSGTILKVETIKKIGMYKSIFFMEGFDIEYSLRCIHNKIKGCKISIWRIEQQFGSGRKIKFFNKEMNIDDHEFWRHFYRGRSLRIILSQNYFASQKLLIVSIIFGHFKGLVKIILFETNAQKKIKFYVHGFLNDSLKEFT